MGDRIENAGGKVVKFMGDSALLFFSADRVDEGVEALIALQEEGNAWLHDRGFASRQIIKAHFGSLCCGLIGTRTEKRFDVFGQTVCIAATMEDMKEAPWLEDARMTVTGAFLVFATVPISQCTAIFQINCS